MLSEQEDNKIKRKTKVPRADSNVDSPGLYLGCMALGKAGYIKKKKKLVN